MADVLVIGVGDSLRGDDGVGAAVIAGLKAETLPDEVRLVALAGEGTELMQAWEGADWVVLIDAANVNGSPGAIRHIDAARTTLPGDLLRLSIHEFGPAHAIELAKALGTLPPRVDLYAIEGQGFTLGAGLSSAVRRAAGKAVALISQNLTKGLELA